MRLFELRNQQNYQLDCVQYRFQKTFLTHYDLFQEIADKSTFWKPHVQIYRTILALFSKLSFNSNEF